jgi:protein tyrosine phosphatase type 4A
MKFTKFEIGVVKYFITECPRVNEIEEIKNIIIKNKINILIRILEPYQLYDVSDIPGLIVENFTDFQDGSVPTTEIMERYIQIIEDAKKKYKNPNILGHCLSSMGRMPTFLGISMIIENSKMDRYDIIIYIRKKRPGALNAKQVNWLIDVKIPSKKKSWEFWKK